MVRCPLTFPHDEVADRHSGNGMMGCSCPADREDASQRPLSGGMIGRRNSADQRTQHARRFGTGHAALWRAVAVDHAGRPLENRRDGRALHGKAGRTPECRCTDRRTPRAVLTFRPHRPDCAALANRVEASRRRLRKFLGQYAFKNRTVLMTLANRFASRCRVAMASPVMNRPELEPVGIWPKACGEQASLVWQTHLS
jgi:hypothetical protein